jgi:hypothetical protein
MRQEGNAFHINELCGGVPLRYEGAKQPPAGEGGRDDSFARTTTETAGNPVVAEWVNGDRIGSAIGAPYRSPARIFTTTISCSNISIREQPIIEKRALKIGCTIRYGSSLALPGSRRVRRRYRSPRVRFAPDTPASACPCYLWYRCGMGSRRAGLTLSME